MMSVPSDAIAVVGLAGRFPGAHDPRQLWELTLAGACTITRRIDSNGKFAWARGLLSSIAEFDPDFFGMSRREALLLDPQHRLLLECACEALADTGSDPRGDKRLRRTAVFMGVNHSGYRDVLLEAASKVSAIELDTATDKDFVATRIAYRLALEGPSITVQSACSTSLVAVHLACQCLLEFEADQALAGAASIVLPGSIGYCYDAKTIHSRDGVCRPFDAYANGTVMGDGAGVVVLRRLEDAIREGARIYAIICGSAINNDGARKAGYAAPSALGQEEVIRAAHVRAGIEPSEIGYIEAHGTGTLLGDSVEIRALKNVFARSTGSCVIGSVKGAIGHLDVAAGAAGMIRCCLALQRRMVPGTVNHITPAPDLDLGSSRFSVLRKAKRWKSEGVRRAGVSSFGVGGTNVHLILEEYRHSRTPPRGASMLTAAGYKPIRLWPESASSGQVHRAGRREPELEDQQPAIEHRRAVWAQIADDEDRRVGPDYERIVLLAHRDIIGEALRARLSASGIPTILTDTIDGIVPDSTSRMLVVCALALAALPQPPEATYNALTGMVQRWPFTSRSEIAIDVVLVTLDAFTVLGSERGDPASAVLTGLARVLTMEARLVRIRAIDIQNTSELDLERIVFESLLWRPEPLVVQRGRRWWCLRYLPVALSEDPRVRSERGTVSVVIGLGQVGRTAARALVEAGHQIVLVARPGASERAALFAARLQCPRSSVSIEECDMGDRCEIRALFQRLHDRYGAINQIVHAAGISGEAAYQNSGNLPCWEHEQHFRVKIGGIAAVAEAVEHFKVGRVVLTSSLAGTLGAPALGPYSAAAAAMDSYADRLDGSSTRWLSVAWDAWWQPRPSTTREAQMLAGGLTRTEAYRTMASLLASSLSGRLVVSKGNFLGRWNRFVSRPLQHTRERHSISTRATITPPEILSLVLEAWRSCLSRPLIGADDNLVELGADSMMWIEVLTCLEFGDRLQAPGGFALQLNYPAIAGRAHQRCPYGR